MIDRADAVRDRTDPAIRALAVLPVQEDLGPVSLHLFLFGRLARTAAWIYAVVQGQLRRCW